MTNDESLKILDTLEDELASMTPEECANMLISRSSSFRDYLCNINFAHIVEKKLGRSISKESEYNLNYFWNHIQEPLMLKDSNNFEASKWIKYVNECASYLAYSIIDMDKKQNNISDKI